MSEKTNIQHLRDILNDSLDDMTEALEFLDAIEEEFAAKDEEVIGLEAEFNELEEELERKGVEYANNDFVGLDVIRWELENGNLKILSQMEDFISELRKQNAAT